jgi:hypothetical protein
VLDYLFDCISLPCSHVITRADRPPRELRHGGRSPTHHPSKHRLVLSFLRLQLSVESDCVAPLKP